MTSRDLMFSFHCKEQEPLLLLGYKIYAQVWDNKLIACWPHLPQDVLVWPSWFWNTGCQHLNIEISHKNPALGFLLGDKKTNYLGTLDPHSWGQQSARAEQLLPSVIAWALQFATFLIIPHCLVPGQFSLICFPFLAPVDLCLQTLATPFLPSTKAYFVLSPISFSNQQLGDMTTYRYFHMCFLKIVS